MNYIRFSDTYDEALLVAELQQVLQQDWPLHFNTKDFNGDWRSISLRSATGRNDDIYAQADVAYKNTPALAIMPYVQQILDTWQCEKEAVRLLSLAPGSEIKPHKDMGCGYRHGNFRIHIPIITNPEVYFTVADETLHLQAGECWYMDFSQTHSIINRGNTARIHLIMDCIRNEWTDQLFAAHGFDLAEKAPSYDAATKARMIEELGKIDTDVARNIIASLKAES
ncbi:aspartyl/asparaginyl beta-hydroxylase domain-containing protein [Chitinophaga filiformis]|uniref:aspartyl/asparaginyl beta-hydroxylase domain-containing protein n=1 Tax=Chitinophaga filiformis TaxID=104663 RepID=UPI001F294895|nr:aspartyl/asparaginyl beta-hydroxylase domain-containing protein [Chitinophaga filiformis]MCF6404489.1 aspartyl/asparaginyl beta-hydroxylase domain-containing protein [Chitinophaga filiformis]